MNIIAGQYKGKLIKSPNDSKTHPMGSREKLALFNMISTYLPNSTVLDVFAGTGALGLEALSRGAQKVVFVEKSAKIARTIRENVQNLDIQAQEKTDIIISDVKTFQSKKTFDIILADPPYDSFDTSLVMPLIRLINPSGILVLSHPHEAPILPGLELLKSHSYAAANISIYALLPQ